MREAIGPTRRIYGVDLSAGMLRKARKLSDHHHWTNIHLTEGDAANYVAPEPLDGVLFSLSYKHDAALSDRVTPDLETASSGRPPGHHGFQASARPWTKTTSAFQSVDDAKSLAAGRPGRHHRPPIIFWRQISSSGQDGLQCPSCARPRHMRLGLLAAVLGSPRPLFSPCSPPWSAPAVKPLSCSRTGSADPARSL